MQVQKGIKSHPSMQRLLNKYEKDVNGILKSLVPVSNDLYLNDSFVEKF